MRFSQAKAGDACSQHQERSDWSGSMPLHLLLIVIHIGLLLAAEQASLLGQQLAAKQCSHQ
jgi:hypothetical protein